MPNQPDDQTQTEGRHAYRPDSPDTPDIPLADAEVPGKPNPAPTEPDPSQQVVSNPDGTNPFGPDTPNIRDEPKTDTLGAPPPKPPAQPLEEDQFAPDYA